MSKTNCKTEAEEQRDFIKWLNENGLHFYAVPNSQQLSGANRKAAAMVMARQKGLGLKPGVPDLCIFLRKKVVYVELKRIKGGVVSPVQKHWLTIINRYDYAEAKVCRGCDEAIAFVESLI